MNMLVVGVCYVYVHVRGLVPLVLVYMNALEIAALVYVYMKGIALQALNVCVNGLAIAALVSVYMNMLAIKAFLYAGMCLTHIGYSRCGARPLDSQEGKLDSIPPEWKPGLLLRKKPSQRIDRIDRIDRPSYGSLDKIPHNP
jgi:hypothetical protein